MNKRRRSRGRQDSARNYAKSKKARQRVAPEIANCTTHMLRARTAARPAAQSLVCMACRAEQRAGSRAGEDASLTSCHARVRARNSGSAITAAGSGPPLLLPLPLPPLSPPLRPAAAALRPAAAAWADEPAPDPGVDTAAAPARGTTPSSLPGGPPTSGRLICRGSSVASTPISAFRSAAAMFRNTDAGRSGPSAGAGGAPDPGPRPAVSGSKNSSIAESRR